MSVCYYFTYLFILSIVSCGQSGTHPEIYLFYDGNGRYHPAIVNPEELSIRWFFFGGSASQEKEKSIQFLLYTRESKNAEKLVIGDVNRLLESKFNKTLPTKIIIHGFTNSDSIGFPPAARNVFLKNNNAPPVNLIIVDWGKLAQAPWYNDAAKNTHLVGVKVARFIEFLVAQGILSDHIHIVGHSLGSHVAGFAGSNLNNITLSRITALDPALPLFGDASDENRIDPSDAEYVDVIHTAGGESSRIKASDINGTTFESPRALAFIERRGHADFYVNGGRNQPGCGMDFFGACSHVRAYEYYLESVVSPKGFLSCKCESWDDYEDDNCACSTVAYMGEGCTSSSKGTFFLRTRSKSPYAMADGAS